MNIGYVNLYVDDLDAAVSFYEGHLGFELRFRDDAHGYASFDAGAVSLGIATIDPSTPDHIATVGGLRASELSSTTSMPNTNALLRGG
ncbi:MAG: VOC family protein [Acidimicrobiales bacterium]|jgi:catechol 2,3-dioxygenase-like lactoylglutathione lyase family enzyme